MKDKLLELCELPQRLLLDEINNRDCIHDANFDLSDSECWGCDVGEECLSLLKVLQNQGLEDLENLSIERLTESIKVAKQYIDNKIQEQRHDIKTCSCELCTWRREVDLVQMESVA